MAQQTGEQWLANVGFGWIPGVGFTDSAEINYSWESFCDANESEIYDWSQHWIPNGTANMIEKMVAVYTIWKKQLNGNACVDSSLCHLS